MTHEDTALQRKFESIKKHAKRAWKAMRDEYEGTNLPLTAVKGESGYMTTGSISSYIRKVSVEATGHDCDKERVAQVRAFLRYTHNVMSMGPVPGEDFTYRIFVRNEWNEFDSVLPLVFGLVKNERESRNWYERKITPSEAGETRKPGEVTTQYQCRKCDARFSTSQQIANHYRNAHPKTEEEKQQSEVKKVRQPPTGIFTKPQEDFLVALADLGGRVHSPHGHAVAKVVEQSKELNGPSASGVALTLFRKGFIFRDKGPHEKTKRTYTLEITKAGWQKLKEIGYTPDEPDAVRVLKKPERPEGAEDDEALIQELGNRLASRLHAIEVLQEELLQEREQPKGDPDSRDKIELVTALVKDFEDGKCTALKAISDIAEAVRL